MAAYEMNIQKALVHWMPCFDVHAMLAVMVPRVRNPAESLSIVLSGEESHDTFNVIMIYSSQACVCFVHMCFKRYTWMNR